MARRTVPEPPGRPSSHWSTRGVFSWLTASRVNAVGSLRQSQKRNLSRGGQSLGPPAGIRGSRERNGSRRRQGNDGLVESGDVGLRGCGIHGVWHPGGLRDPSLGVCSDASPGPACGSEGAGGSGAGALRGQGSGIRDRLFGLERLSRAFLNPACLDLN